MPAGLWLEGAASLTIQVQSRFPVLASTAGVAGSLAEDLIGRVVLVINACDFESAQTIHEIIVAYNIFALGIVRKTFDEKKKALMNMKLGREQREDLELVSMIRIDRPNDHIG